MEIRGHRFSVLGLLVLLPALTLGAAAGAAEPAALAAQPAGGPLVCGEPASTAGLFEAKGGPGKGGGGECFCLVRATCHDESTVSCSDSTSPCDCHAVDSDCDFGTRGYVSCNGITTWCPECPSSCPQEGESCTTSAQCDECPGIPCACIGGQCQCL